MNIAVIGGGASGLVAAGAASNNGASVDLYEANEKLGKKIYITGKGRCNVTNACDLKEFFANIVTNEKFTFSCVNKFTSLDTIQLLNKYGTATIVERGNRVYPQSNKASDITKALAKYATDGGTNIFLNSKVTKISVCDNGFNVCTINSNKKYNKVIIASGGISYSATGSTGDGYKFAQIFGHKIVKLKPALVGFETEEKYGLQGLSLINVSASLIINNKLIASEFGEMLFTHNGISGPIILTLSSYANKYDLSDCYVSIDLKPALSYEQLDNKIVREFALSNGTISSYLRGLLPKSLISIVLTSSKINGMINVSNISSIQRRSLIETLKNLKIKIKSLNDIETAIITSGGVDCKQVNPSTMQSKLVPNLYFCGEVLDIDALTGGFNMQLAFSSGWLAGTSAASKGE